MNNNLTIIIITFERGEDLKSLLKSITKQIEYQNIIYQVIIINNGTKIGYEWVDEYINENKNINIVFYQSKINLGVSRGRKLGIEMSKSEILVFIDDDAEFLNREALYNINQFFKCKNSTIAALAFKIIHSSNHQIQKNAFPHKKFLKYQNINKFETSYFIGAGHAIKREAIIKSGNYSQDIFYGMEEYELSYKLIKAGFKICYVHNVEILHKESLSGRQHNKIKNQMLWKNKSIITWKYLPLKYFISTTILWSLNYLVQSKFDVAGFFKVYYDIFKNLRKEDKDALSKNSLFYLKTIEARLWY